MDKERSLSLRPRSLLNRLKKILPAGRVDDKELLNRYREFYLKIDGFIWTLPEHNINEARSHSFVGTESLFGLPLAARSFLGVEGNCENKTACVSACSRLGIEMSVSLQVKNRRARFNINQKTHTPELHLEEWSGEEWIDPVEQVNLKWEQFELAIKIAEKSLPERS